jgi:hypothetical protein
VLRAALLGNVLRAALLGNVVRALLLGNVLRAGNLGNGERRILMTKKNPKPKTKEEREQEKLELEEKRMVKMDPLAACERQRSLLSLEVEDKLKEVSEASGNDELDAALHSALDVYRQYALVGHEMHQITGRSIYRVRSPLKHLLGSEYLRLRLEAFDAARPLPRAALPKAALRALDALRASYPKKIFEGEHEYQEHLKANGLVEADPNADYVSQTLTETTEAHSTVFGR